MGETVSSKDFPYNKFIGCAQPRLSSVLLVLLPCLHTPTCAPSPSPCAAPVPLSPPLPQITRSRN
jgi:hypothetical protein